MPARAVLDLVISLKGDAEAQLASLSGGLLTVGGLVGGTLVAGFGLATGAAVSFASEAQQGVRDLQAQLGLTEEQAGELGDLAKDVFANNWGTSLSDVNDALGLVYQKMTDLNGVELEGATQSAIALRDVFGVDVPESVNAAKTLMDQFGLTQEQAFDFITKGFQSGLNSSDDFLDSITEYSTQFRNGGADAGEFFSLLQSGLQGGVLGTDKAADAFKEFRLRIGDGSKTTADALKAIGLDTLDDQLAKGKITGVDAFKAVQRAIVAIRDPTRRMQIATALVGTQYEDLGDAAFAALDLTAVKLDDIAGATDSLSKKYGGWGNLWEGVKRKALVAIEPIGGALLDIANEAMPVVEGALDWLSTELPPMIETARGFILDLWDAFNVGTEGGGIAGGISNLLYSLDGISPIFDTIGDAVVYLADNALPLLNRAIALVIDNWDAIEGALIAVGALLAGPVVVGALGAVAGALGAVLSPAGLLIAAVAALGAAWSTDFGGIRTATLQMWEQTVKPALSDLWTWLQVNLPIAIATAKQFWDTTLMPALRTGAEFIAQNVIPVIGDVVTWLRDNLPPAIQTAADFFNTTLLPAMKDIWDFIQTDLVPLLTALGNVTFAALGKALEAIAAVWKSTLQPALSELWGYINDNLLPATDDLARGWGVVTDAIRDVTKYFNDLAAKISTFKLPDWMTAGVPTVPAEPAPGGGGSSGFGSDAPPPRTGTGTPRAGGGQVIRGIGYPVGEAGPEWFVPSNNGTIIPNSRMSGNVTLHAPITIGSLTVDSDEREARLRALIAQTVEEAFDRAVDQFELGGIT